MKLSERRGTSLRLLLVVYVLVAGYGSVPEQTLADWPLKS